MPMDEIHSTDSSADSRSPQVDMFRAIDSARTDQLKHLGQMLHLLDQNKAAALLSLDHAFKDMNDLKMGNSYEVLSSVQQFHSYVRLLQEIITHPKPWSSVSIQRLFGFSEASDDHIVLVPRTFLYQSYARRNFSVLPEGSVKLPRSEFRTLFQISLSEHLMTRIVGQSQVARHCRIFEPCIATMATGHCDRPDSCGHEHNPNLDWYQNSVRFHLQQISILQVLCMLPLPMSSRDFEKQ